MPTPTPQPVEETQNVELPSTPTDSASFGRVAEDGTVYVRTPDGEKPVGSYPGKPDEEALAYFARKYDDLHASAVLLRQRIAQTEVSVKDSSAGLESLRQQVASANVVGDLPALDMLVEDIATALKVKAQIEGEARAAAKVEATSHREAIVAEAEEIAAQDEGNIHWKRSTARMRELLDAWKEHQKTTIRLDRSVETALWKRFSTARSRFDKTRRSYFAALDQTHSEAKAAKEALVAEAEKLTESTDWGATAGAFKRLMGQWREAGRASRRDDDRLWKRFKAAQDHFFAAKDAHAAKENEVYEANAAKKREILAEAEALLPITNIGRARAALRDIQDRWDAAGRVPRRDLDALERGLRRVEQAVRDAQNRKRRRPHSEVSVRANSMVTQLEDAITKLTAAREDALTAGNDSKVKSISAELETKQAWLEQVQSTAKDLKR